MVLSSTLARSMRSALGLGFAGLLVLSGCGKSNASVASASAGATGCPSDQLSLFNKEGKNWFAACGERVFMCTETRKGAECAQQDPKALGAATMERVRALNSVPKPQRDIFTTADITKGTWEAYAKTIAAVSKLKPAQAKAVPEASRLYTDFSPGFDNALASCLGADGVAKVSVAQSGSLTVSPSNSCLVGLRGAADLGPLRAQPGNTFYLAAGVRDVQPIDHPVDPTIPPKPVAPPGPSENSKNVRVWLDSAAKDIATCADAEQVVVSVKIDEQGVATASLREEFAGTPAEGCVRAALPAQTFTAGLAEEVVHLVKKPEPTPEEIEAAKKDSKKKGNSSKSAKSSSAKDSKKEKSSSTTSAPAPAAGVPAPATSAAAPSAPKLPAAPPPPPAPSAK